MITGKDYDALLTQLVEKARELEKLDFQAAKQLVLAHLSPEEAINFLAHLLTEWAE